MHCSVLCRLNLFKWFLGKCFLVELSASLHESFLHFLEKCFSVTCFGTFVAFLGGDNKCVCVNVLDGWC